VFAFSTLTRGNGILKKKNPEKKTKQKCERVPADLKKNVHRTMARFRHSKCRTRDEREWKSSRDG
jgi:hypothetical protein